MFVLVGLSVHSVMMYFHISTYWQLTQSYAESTFWNQKTLRFQMSFCVHVFTVFNMMMNHREIITKISVICFIIIFCPILSVLSLRHSNLKCMTTDAEVDTLFPLQDEWLSP